MQHTIINHHIDCNLDQINTTISAKIKNTKISQFNKQIMHMIDSFKGGTFNYFVSVFKAQTEN